MRDFYIFPAHILAGSEPLPLHISLEPLHPHFPSTLSPSPHPSSPMYSTDLTDSNVQEAASSWGTASAVVKQFVSTKKTKKCAKLENVRSTMIRCWKKSMRHIKSHEVTFTGIKKFPSKVPLSVMREYTSKVVDNLEFCQKLGQTEEGPGIDSKHSQSRYKTYNNDCLKELFQTPLHRELWQAFVKVVFSDSDLDSLAERFEFRCCRQKTHGPGCVRKWQELRTVIGDYMGSREVRVKG